jgi:hypothetical protein
MNDRWICDGCKTEYAEYVKGCLKCSDRGLYFSVRAIPQPAQPASLSDEEIADRWASKYATDVPQKHLFSYIAAAIREATTPRDARIAELERESSFNEQLAKAKSPCGHLETYAYTEDGGKHIVCLLCERDDVARTLRGIGESAISEAAIRDRLAALLSRLTGTKTTGA